MSTCSKPMNARTASCLQPDTITKSSDILHTENHRDRKLLLFTLSVLEAHAPVFNSTRVSAQNAGNFSFSEAILSLYHYCISELLVNQLRCCHMLHQLPDPPTLPLNEGGNPLRAFHPLSEEEQETGQDHQNTHTHTHSEQC